MIHLSIKINKVKMNKCIVIVLVSLIFISCDRDFKSINTSPNFPNEVHPSLLLRQIIYNYGEEMSYEGFVAGNLLSQHFTMVDFNLFDRHSLSDPQLGGNPWPVIYKNISDNEILLGLTELNDSYEVYQGPSLILKSYMAAALTDIYGDVPYSEAFNGINGITLPKYDKQKEIYNGPNGILENLNKGITAIMNYEGNFNLEGDILFNGDLDSWILFANSLKIKCLVRISDKMDVSSELQELYEGNYYIQENLNNATFDFSNNRPNSFRMQQLRDGDFNLFVLSQTASEILERLNDPRIEILYRPNGNDDTNSVFTGLLNGPDASITSISVNEFALTGTIFRNHTGDLDANFITAWEVQFLLAEAAEKGMITSDAKAHYDLGVEMAFSYWHTVLPVTYLTDDALYGKGGEDKIEQIITQKWIANSINGYEGWIEYRRTGFPKLKAIAASLNNDIFPVRMPYPTEELTLNTVNFNFATNGNGNDVNIPVWWDVN